MAIRATMTPTLLRPHCSPILAPSARGNRHSCLSWAPLLLLLLLLLLLASASALLLGSAAAALDKGTMTTPPPPPACLCLCRCYCCLASLHSWPHQLQGRRRDWRCGCGYGCHQYRHIQCARKCHPSLSIYYQQYRFPVRIRRRYH